MDYIKDSFGGKKCDVLGMGISNQPLVRLLVEAGAQVTVHDKVDNIDMLGDTGREFEGMGVRFILGENYLSGIDGDYVFRSPGVYPYQPELEAAVARGAVLTSEMEFFLENTPATVIGVTGSDGKTTTTTIISILIKKQLERNGKGRMYLGGNIGAPLLPHLNEMTSDDFAVVELSSFQLQTAKVSTDRAVITNLSPNHLNWHTDMAQYCDAKCNIFCHERCKRLITNADNAVTAEIAGKCNKPVTLFSLEAVNLSAPAVFERNGEIILRHADGDIKVMDTSDILLPGRHNTANYMTAIGAVDGIVDLDLIKEVARTFPGVPHRLELIRTFNGVKFYNSSIDSSPTRTAAALSALREKPIIICCGRDKHVPLDPLVDALIDRAKAIVLSGEVAGLIENALSSDKRYNSELLPMHREEDFTDAVLYAAKIAKPGDTVLLSPSATSFDAFKNFEERGNRFREIVNGL